MELHVNTRGNLTPNPDYDPIGFICYTIYEQKPTSGCLFDENTFENHLILFDQSKKSMATKRYLGIESVKFMSKTKFKSIEYVYEEKELFEIFIKAIRKHDPDIFVGFEIQKLSWCYLVRRALKLEINEFIMMISRIPKGKRESVLRISFNKPNDPNKKQSGPKVDILPIPLELVIAGKLTLEYTYS
jgi:DNA polymerase zeta